MLGSMTSEIREIRDDDLPAVTRILDEAYGPSPGRAARVRRYRALGADSWLLALRDGAPAGVAGMIDYDGAYAYVGLVGVLPSEQRRGIAGALMDAVLALAEARGVATLLLDASDAGEPLYRKLGFVVEDTVRLFVKNPHARFAPPRAARPMAREDLAAVAALDRVSTGADRSRLLGIYLDEAPDRAFVVPGPEGAARAYAFAQRFAVGPWAATDPTAADAALVAALACDFPDGLTIASPSANATVAALLGPRGFAHARSLAHMRLGPPVARRRDLVYGQASLAAG